MDAPICQGCVEREARIADLERRMAELELRNRQLEELLLKFLGQLPPPPATAARPKADLPKPDATKPSGKKAGGQPGHSPHLKKLLPLERKIKGDASQSCSALRLLSRPYHDSDWGWDIIGGGVG
jgi:hypothetical protein